MSVNRYDIAGLPSLADPSRDVGVDLSVEPYNAQLITATFGGTEQVSFDGYGKPDNGGVVTVSCGTTMKVINLDTETGIPSMQ